MHGLSLCASKASSATRSHSGCPGILRSQISSCAAGGCRGNPAMARFQQAFDSRWRIRSSSWRAYWATSGVAVGDDGLQASAASNELALTSAEASPRHPPALSRRFPAWDGSSSRCRIRTIALTAWPRCQRWVVAALPCQSGAPGTRLVAASSFQSCGSPGSGQCRLTTRRPPRTESTIASALNCLTSRAKTGSQVDGQHQENTLAVARVCIVFPASRRRAVTKFIP